MSLPEIHLGKTIIENTNNKSEIVNGEIKYGFEGKLAVKIEFPNMGLMGLPVKVSDNTSTLRNFDNGQTLVYNDIKVLYSITIKNNKKN